MHQGGSVKPVKISPQVEWLVLECVKIIGLDIAGVDLLIDKASFTHTHTHLHIEPQTKFDVRASVSSSRVADTAVHCVPSQNTYKICEVNSSPGFEGLEKALGENIAIKMFLYMKMRLGVWRRGGKLNRGITVPVGEDDDVSTGAAAAAGAGGAADRDTREGEEKKDGREQRAGGTGGAASGVNVSMSGVGLTVNAGVGDAKDERDRFRTMPRNRSMKRTSGGQ